MQLITNWLKSPDMTKGLDHVGTQAPCLMIYGQLVPGVTNVTDRARYFSFYTWLAWSYHQRFGVRDRDHFVERFRRADCLFTLVSERHAQVTDEDNERHGAAMIGREKLVPAVRQLAEGGSIRLSTYATLESTEQRYFQNRLGGLSQYYVGTLTDLGLIQNIKSGWLTYTTERAIPLAKSLDDAVPSKRFWELVEKDKITAADLDALSPFCACSISDSPDEQEQLISLFFDTNRQYAEEGQQRKRTLALIEHLIDSLPAGMDISEELFRACVYSGALPERKKWQLPGELTPLQEGWSFYVRNDLLSVAFQTIFAVCLRELEPQTATEVNSFQSIEAFAEWFGRSKLVANAFRKLGVKTFSQLVSTCRNSGPPLADWSNPAHEIRLGQQMTAGWKQGDDSARLLINSMHLLAMLVARDNLEQAPYGGLAITADMLKDAPINLASVRERAQNWQELSLHQVFAHLVSWTLQTHLRVALRKLRQSGRSTFHLHPSEQGLKVVFDSIPPPSQTSPRFRQAVHILRDIGALTRDDNGNTQLTKLGRELMETACD